MKTKNLFAMAAAIVVASGLAACSGEAFVNDTPQEELQKKVTLSVTATQGERKQGTRMNYAETTSTPVGMTLTWEDGDLLGVEPADAVDVSSFEQLTGASTDAGKSTMNFTGSVEESRDGTYFFYYPAQDMSGPSFEAMEPNILSLSLANQSNTLTWTGANGVASTDDLWKYNLLYTPKAVDPSKGGITLTHACALLRFVLKLPADAPKVDKLYISTWQQKLPSTTMNLTFNGDGTASAGSGTIYTLSLSLNNDVQKSEVRTITAYMMVAAVSDFSGQLCKVSLVNSTSGATYSYIYNLTEKTASDAQGNFKGGTVYTFAPSDPLQEDKWAGSNIYWSGSKLVFETNAYEMRYTAYQGLFFKWGSLTGLSPIGTQWSGTSRIYSNSGGESTGATWTNIDQYRGAIVAEDKLPPSYDICYELTSGAWRMPTKAELPTATATAVGNSGAITTTATRGTSNVRVGHLFNKQVYIPNAGGRDYAYGELYSAGTSNQYWSNTAYDSNDVYIMQNGKLLTTGYYNDAALPIRCIKKAAGE